MKECFDEIKGWINNNSDEFNVKLVRKSEGERT
jgi:hypothetical protein